jgi:hypothetical protein
MAPGIFGSSLRVGGSAGVVALGRETVRWPCRRKPIRIRAGGSRWCPECLAQGTDRGGKSVGLARIVTVARQGQCGCTADGYCRAQSDFQLAQHCCLSIVSFGFCIWDRTELRFIPRANLRMLTRMCARPLHGSPTTSNICETRAHAETWARVPGKGGRVRLSRKSGEGQGINCRLTQSHQRTTQNSNSGEPTCSPS